MFEKEETVSIQCEEEWAVLIMSTFDQVNLPDLQFRETWKVFNFCILFAIFFLLLLFKYPNSLVQVRSVKQ